MKGRNEELIRFKYAFGSTDIKAILVTQNDENKSKKKKNLEFSQKLITICWKHFSSTLFVPLQQ